MPRGPVSIAFLGVAFARVWLTMLVVEPPSGVAVASLSHSVFDFGYVAVSLACALGARRIVPLSKGHGWYAAALLGMVSASCVWVCGGAIGIAPAAFPIAAAIGGGAYGLFLLLNAEVFAGLSALRIILYLSGARILACVMVFLLGDAGFLRCAFALLCLPCVAVFLVYVSYHSLPEVDHRRPVYPRFAYPWKLVALVGIFSFAYGMRQASLVAGAGQHSSLSTALVMGCVFIATYFFSDRIDVSRLCRLPLPLMLCGVTLIPAEGIFGQVVSSYLVSTGYTLLTFLVAILLYDMAKRTGVPIVPLAAGANAMQAFVVLGAGVSGRIEALAGGAVGSIAASLLVLVAVAVSFALLFSERELASRWGIRILEEPSLNRGTQAELVRAQRREELARLYQLTPREEEVLLELSQGKDNQAIARDLLIAPGTLKAHTRHIYEKMGIHKRSELDQLLGMNESK